MNVENLSTLYTISFTRPRLNPNRDGDFCVYFTLESDGSNTFVTDLALFIRALGRDLIRWSVLGRPDRLDPGDPTHPKLRDIAYCWDGVACAHGVLQFSASDVSVMNIHRVFHRTSQIFGAICQTHWYEYFARGIFSDVEQAVLPLVFTEMEVAAQYMYQTPLQFIPEMLICVYVLGSCVMAVSLSSISWTAPNVFHTEQALPVSTICT